MEVDGFPRGKKPVAEFYYLVRSYHVGNLEMFCSKAVNLFVIKGQINTEKSLFLRELYIRPRQAPLKMFHSPLICVSSAFATFQFSMVDLR